MLLRFDLVSKAPVGLPPNTLKETYEQRCNCLEPFLRDIHFESTVSANDHSSTHRPMEIAASFPAIPHQSALDASGWLDPAGSFLSA